MISVLPSHIPGETFESLLARLGRRTYVNGIRPLRREVRGQLEGLISPLEFIANLAVPEWMSLDDLLEQHTLLPIIRPFLDAAEAERLRERIARGLGNSVVSSLLAERERQCPDCRREEFDSFNEAGIRIFHQLRWITRCQVHQCMLSDGRDLSAEVFPNELLACASTLSRPDIMMLNGIQKSTVWLAKAKLPALGRKHWRAFHRAALTRRFDIGYPYPRRELHKISRLVSKRLTKLLWLPSLSHYSNWLEAAVLRPNGVPHPLHHILLLRLCGETAASAVEKIQARKAALGNWGHCATQLQLPLMWAPKSKAPGENGDSPSE
jgi:hypothetical protein